MTKTLKSKISEGAESDLFNLKDGCSCTIMVRIFVVIENKTDQAPKNLDKSLSLEKNDKNEFKHPIQRIFS